jgi:hypothetical protein
MQSLQPVRILCWTAEASARRNPSASLNQSGDNYATRPRETVSMSLKEIVSLNSLFLNVWTINFACPPHVYHELDNHVLLIFRRCTAQTGQVKGLLLRDLVHPLEQAVHRGEQLRQAAGQPRQWNQVSSNITGQAGCSLVAITAAAAPPGPRGWIQVWVSRGPRPFPGQRSREGPVTSPSTAASSSCPWAASRGNNDGTSTANDEKRRKDDAVCDSVNDRIPPPYLSTVPLEHPIISMVLDLACCIITIIIAW